MPGRQHRTWGRTTMAMDIQLSFSSISDSDNREFLSQVLYFLDDLDIRPDKYNYSEPINKKFSEGEIPKIVETVFNQPEECVRGLQLERKKNPSYYIYIDLDVRGMNMITGSISLKKENKKELDLIVKNFTVMFSSLDLEYGYLALNKEIRKRNYYESTDVYPSGYTHTGMARGGIYLEEGLPGLYWINYFGKKYQDHFGISKLKSCPAVLVDDLGTDKLMVRLYDSPSDFDSSDIQQSAVRHLGEKSFFDNEDIDRKLDSAGVIFS